MVNDGFGVVIDGLAWYLDYTALSTSQLLVAWDLEIDTDTSDRLALALVDDNWEHKTHWELAVLEIERNFHVVFGRQEDDAKNECHPAMVVASDDFCLWNPVQYPRKDRFFLILNYVRLQAVIIYKIKGCGYRTSFVPGRCKHSLDRCLERCFHVPF